MATLAARLLAFAQAVGADIKAMQAAIASAGGGADPWTRTKLAADYTNALATFATITGFSYTPPAGKDFVLEAELLLWTTNAANLPRVGVNVGANANNGYGSIIIQQAGATNTAVVQALGGYNNNAAAVNVQMAAGGLPTTLTPYWCWVQVKGRAGTAPQPIALQLAAETAGANIVFVKAGSEMRSRVIA